MASGATVKLSVEGISQFKTNMNQAKQAVKTLDSQLALTEKQFKASGDAESYMTEKAELLKAKLEQQKQILTNAEKALQDMADKGIDKASKSYQDMYRQMINAKGGLIDTQAEMDNLTASCDEASNGVSEIKNQLNNIGEQVSFENITNKIDGLTGKMAAAARKALQIGKNLIRSSMDSASYADDLLTRAAKYGADYDAELVQQMDIIRDLTEERRAADLKLFNARHDQLTGLFNRDYLYERTKELLAENPEEKYLIITAEITDLKVINDLYGNTFGDRALKFAADWLLGNENLNPGSVYGRLGGESFGVCIPEKNFRLERMENALSTLTVFEGETKYRMLIHAGIYRVDDRNLKASVMYDRAVLALEGIKDDYHYHTAWYEPYMRENALRNRRIAEELTAAIADGQIRPWLQPIVDREGNTVGAEALARWIHPVEGIRFPGDCIPVLEKNGMIAELDRCIWRQACEVLARWKEEGKDLFLSVNISPRDFFLLDVAGELKSLVQEYGVEPIKLRLEITESVMMTDDENRMKILRDLQSCGFLIEMDDFGSGYSSLNLLREMPVDVLKIDMVFLRNIADQERERARVIVEEVIVLAKRLGITSLTEGVETEYQYNRLLEMGCQLYQGFYFAKPMPVEEFERLYASGPE